jgi:hypothetical protein
VIWPRKRVQAVAQFWLLLDKCKGLVTLSWFLLVGKDLEAVLRKIEYWHQAPIITFSIMARHGRGAWHGVQWDGQTATSFPLNETDEKKAMQALLLKNPLEEAANASDRGGRDKCRRI